MLYCFTPFSNPTDGIGEVITLTPKRNVDPSLSPLLFPNAEITANEGNEQGTGAGGGGGGSGRGTKTRAKGLPGEALKQSPLSVFPRGIGNVCDEDKIEDYESNEGGLRMPEIPTIR